MKQGIEQGLVELRTRREQSQHYGDSGDEDGYAYITDIYMVLYVYKSQLENTARMIECLPDVAKKVKANFRKSNTGEMVKPYENFLGRREEGFKIQLVCLFFS